MPPEATFHVRRCDLGVAPEVIGQAVEAFGGKVVMTSTKHSSGTERCAEAASLYEKESGLRFSYVVNIQGDEPLIQSRQLQTLLDCILVPNTSIATLIRPLNAVEGE